MVLDPYRIREDFPILKREVNDHPLIYLDNAATTQKPGERHSHQIEEDGRVDDVNHVKLAAQTKQEPTQAQACLASVECCLGQTARGATLMSGGVVLPGE